MLSVRCWLVQALRTTLPAGPKVCPSSGGRRRQLLPSVDNADGDRAQSRADAWALTGRSRLSGARSLLARWSTLAGELEAAMQRVFYPDAVDEWLEENVRPSLQRLQQLLQDLGEAAGAQSPRAGPGPDPRQEP